MVKEDILINRFKLEDVKGNKSLHLINCIINNFDFMGVFNLDFKLIIESCIITTLGIHSCWFTNGLHLKNCIIKNYVDYQMGGHNTMPILIEGNIFTEFFNFFDCQFEGIIEIRNNVFIKGTNLLGNKGQGFENIFNKGWIIDDNLGQVDLDGVGM